MFPLISPPMTFRWAQQTFHCCPFFAPYQFERRCMHGSSSLSTNIYRCLPFFWFFYLEQPLNFVFFVVVSKDSSAAAASSSGQNKGLMAELKAGYSSSSVCALCRPVETISTRHIFFDQQPLDRRPQKDFWDRDSAVQQQCVYQLI